LLTGSLVETYLNLTTLFKNSKLIKVKNKNMMMMLYNKIKLIRFNNQYNKTLRKTTSILYSNER